MFTRLCTGVILVKNVTLAPSLFNFPDEDDDEVLISFKRQRNQHNKLTPKFKRQKIYKIMPNLKWTIPMNFSSLCMASRYGLNLFKGSCFNI